MFRPKLLAPEKLWKRN